MQWIELDYYKPINQQFISLQCSISFCNKGLSSSRLDAPRFALQRFARSQPRLKGIKAIVHSACPSSRQHFIIRAKLNLPINYPSSWEVRLLCALENEKKALHGSGRASDCRSSSRKIRIRISPHCFFPERRTRLHFTVSRFHARVRVSMHT